MDNKLTLRILCSRGGSLGIQPCAVISIGYPDEGAGDDADLVACEDEGDLHRDLITEALSERRDVSESRWWNMQSAMFVTFNKVHTKRSVPRFVKNLANKIANKCAAFGPRPIVEVTYVEPKR